MGNSGLLQYFLQLNSFDTISDMKALVTGSSGHLGEALVRTLQARGIDTIGLDILNSQYTSVMGSITDRTLVERCMDGTQVVFHAATLHKPHVATHEMQDFVDTNITGTLTLLQAAVKAGVESFVFTSTTSVFGDAMKPRDGEATIWVTEEVQPLPRNIYGTTKIAAENLCHLFHRKTGLPCIILRTSRFFPEEDDDRRTRDTYSDDNLKANEFLFRRVDLEDVVSAHLAASENAAKLGFGRYIISATTPFTPEDLSALRVDAPTVVNNRAPEYLRVYSQRGWKMFDGIDRVYVNSAARRDLEWEPVYDFNHVVHCLKQGRDFRSSLAREVGMKGYHAQTFDDGPYPVANERVSSVQNASQTVKMK